MRDWEQQRDLLFMHDNHKFIGLTPRMHRQQLVDATNIKHPADFWLWVAAAGFLVWCMFALPLGWI